MLTKIFVSNYLLISHLEVDFSDGFTVITGETGAGKSILLGALSLILGGRADVAGIGNTEKKIVAEGEFSIGNYDLKTFFEENNLDYDPQATHLRREISASGKSRGFINDTPVSMNLLKSLGERLVDIHSQHENQLLLKSAYQLQFLDEFAKITKQVKEFSEGYHKYKVLLNKRKTLLEADQKARQEEDFIRFQLAEMEEAQLQTIDYIELQNELDVLENADAILASLQKALCLNSEEEINAISLLQESLKSMQNLHKMTSSYDELTARLNSVCIELADINSEIEYQMGLVESNPEKAEFIRQKMDKVNHLLFKHSKSEISELLDLEKSMVDRLRSMERNSEEIGETESQISELEKKLNEWALQMSKQRKEAAPKLEKLIIEGLQFLGMPNARIQIEVRDIPEFSNTGRNEIVFNFSANKGFALYPLEKVASGGERSRLMLVLKKIFASLSSTPTLILDEIDTGISGEIAAKTAQMLSEMAENAQIITITHLPQVAGKAKHHFQVTKTTVDAHTETHLVSLNKEQRKLEIARMLSGEIITEAAIQNATQLMN